MVMIQAPLDIVMKINAIIKRLPGSLIKTGPDSNSIKSENSIISCKEIGYLSVLNDKILLTIKPTKKMSCNDIARKDNFGDEVMRV
ncbi:23264_t:CDS:2 [Racocetra persica]|uniref:23264_t:CDS:1 n=1 Tax=Racocetra persica TaxID=160502 RepID=A0ACA9N6Z0_9GLOM|nr:23264_t:CDS:2 [Racocetra persica]